MSTKFNSIISIFENENLNENQKKKKLAEIHDDSSSDSNDPHPSEHDESAIIHEIPSFKNRLQMWEGMNKNESEKQNNSKPKKVSQLKTSAKTAVDKLSVNAKTKDKKNTKKTKKTKTKIESTPLCETDSDDPFDTPSKKTNTVVSKKITSPKKSASPKKTVLKKEGPKKTVPKKSTPKKAVKKVTNKPVPKKSNKKITKSRPIVEAYDSESSDDSSFDPFTM